MSPHTSTHIRKERKTKGQTGMRDLEQLSPNINIGLYLNWKVIPWVIFTFLSLLCLLIKVIFYFKEIKQAEEVPTKEAQKI